MAVLTSLNIPAPESCELCAKDVRVDGSRLCVSCLEAIVLLVGLTTAQAEAAAVYRKRMVAGGAQ